jgi:hypothetical protein
LSASDVKIKKTKSKDTRYILKDGHYRTISSWENPLVEEPVESNVRGKGAIIDIYIESRPGGSVYWRDNRQRGFDSVVSYNDSDSDSESESESESDSDSGSSDEDDKSCW